MVIDSTFLFFIAFIWIALMVFGHVSKIRIFNLFSVLVCIFLATQLYQNVILLLLFIGISIYELYFTFLGGQ